MRAERVHLGMKVGAPHAAWEDRSKLPIKISRLFSRRRKEEGDDHLVS